MIVINRRAAGFAALVLLATALSACGDSEPDQRKAFIGFLQKYIIDKPGVHVPKPTDEDSKSFGVYASHYAVITDFVGNPEMRSVGEKMQAVTQRANISSAQDLVDHRADLKSVSDGLATLITSMNRELAKTNAARAALKQPDDLKAIYDKAYEQDVIAPARGFNEVTPIVMDISAASLKLADYIVSHRDKVVLSGKNISGRDAQTAKDIDNLVKALNSNAPRYKDAQQRLRVVLEGS
jgi:hypothetical protein